MSPAAGGVPARHELPEIDAAALDAARAADLALAVVRDSGYERWVTYLDRLPDRLRDDSLRDLRGTARRVRAAFGPRDDIRDVLPDDIAAALMRATDKLLKAIARHDAQH